jgi:hypothetical protein
VQTSIPTKKGGDVDNQHLTEEKKKGIEHLTEALGEQARSEGGSREEGDAKEHRADAEQEIARARDKK